MEIANNRLLSDWPLRLPCVAAAFCDIYCPNPGRKIPSGPSRPEQRNPESR